LVAQAGFDVAIDAVVANVQLTPDVPLRVRRLPLIELLPGLKEGDSLRLFGPEVVEALGVDLRLGVGLLAECGAWRVAAVFDLQRLYGLISSLRAPIQRSWGPGGHVHVVDSPEIGGPGPRVSQSRIRLRNHGDVVVVELFAYVDGSSRANPDAGLDREIRVAEIEPLDFVTELYRTAVGFLQVALNLDLLLGDASWLFEHAAANHFVSAGQWATVGDVYRLATREFAVADSFETVSSLLEPKTEASASNGSNGSGGDEAELHLSIEQLQRYVEPQPDL